MKLLHADDINFEVWYWQPVLCKEFYLLHFMVNKYNLERNQVLFEEDGVVVRTFYMHAHRCGSWYPTVPNSSCQYIA